MTPGQIIVHPFHGPVRVIGSATRTFRQKPTEYVELEALSRPLRISVPVSAVGAVGLRSVFGPAGLKRVLDVLGAPSEEYENTWSRRIKDYQLKLQTGDLEQRVAVMREIIRQRGPYPPPGAERDLLREVRDNLVAEISLAISISPEDAESMLNDAAHPRTPALTQPDRTASSSAPTRPTSSNLPSAAHERRPRMGHHASCRRGPLRPESQPT